MKVAIMYMVFSVLSIVANIGGQDFSLRIYGGLYCVSISVMTGTGIGLFVKYFLDKNYIFRYRVEGVSQDAKTFIMYTAMGVLPTAIFLGFEFWFEFVFRSKEMRYLGGIIGLTIGYFVKYQLDKRFVFTAKG
jgi:cytochrome b subunit of formate dehydrogenase